MAYRFERRYQSFCNSLDSLAEAENRDRTDSFVLSGTSAKYCITFELAWKTMKDILIEYYDIHDFVTGSPRDTLRQAFGAGLISDDKWMEMSKLRNELAHDYDLSMIERAFSKIVDEYIPLFRNFENTVHTLIERNQKNKS